MLQGILWGTLPIGSSIVALLLVLFLRERRRYAETIQFPLSQTEPIFREVRS